MAISRNRCFWQAAGTNRWTLDDQGNLAPATYSDSQAGIGERLMYIGYTSGNDRWVPYHCDVDPIASTGLILGSPNPALVFSPTLVVDDANDYLYAIQGNILTPIRLWRHDGTSWSGPVIGSVRANTDTTQHYGLLDGDYLYVTADLTQLRRLRFDTGVDTLIWSNSTAPAGSFVVTTQDGDATHDEINVVTVTPSLPGSFTINYGVSSAGPPFGTSVAHNTTAAAFRAALEGLVGAGNVSVVLTSTLGNGDHVFTITAVGANSHTNMAIAIPGTVPLNFNIFGFIVTPTGGIILQASSGISGTAPCFYHLRPSDFVIDNWFNLPSATRYNTTSIARSVTGGLWVTYRTGSAQWHIAEITEGGTVISDLPLTGIYAPTSASGGPPNGIRPGPPLGPPPLPPVVGGGWTIGHVQFKPRQGGYA